MKRIAFGLLRRGWLPLFALLPLVAMGTQAPNPPAEVQVVRYAQLADWLRDQQGKVVVIDFWATSCVPCKLGMPRLTELQRLHASDGLIVVTVATDELEASEREATIARVRKCLGAAGAQSTVNLLLDESTEVLTKNLRVTSLPCIYVFGRDGRWKQFAGSDLEKDAQHRYPTVEAWVKQQLAR